MQLCQGFEIHLPTSILFEKVLCGQQGLQDGGGTDAGCQLSGVLRHCLAWSTVSTALETRGGPEGWLWHHVYTTYYVMGPPFFLVSLSRFKPSRGWKENRLDSPNKTEDNNDPKDTTAEKFLGPLHHNGSVWVTGMMSLPLLTQSVQSPFASILKL